MAEKTNAEQWQWQTEGTSWKGVGIYHVTLTVTSRAPLLGTLVVPDNDPTQARIEHTELGRALLDSQRSIATFHPEIQILQYCLMPDHLHSIWYVRRPMQQSIRYVAQGFWRAAKKVGRAYSYLNSRLTGGTINENAMQARGYYSLSSIAAADSQENPLRQWLSGEDYSSLDPIFTEVPFIRPMSRHGQLQTMIHYVQLNPQRLATKRLMPGFFRVQRNIKIAGRTYASIGNLAILQSQRYATIHVHHEWVDAAVQGKPQTLRDYMNGCVLAARRGVVMVSPFISPREKDVQNVLLAEQHPIIVLADNGFRDYYKPPTNLFDGVAAGRVIILSPWEYDAGKRHISRADCVLLNTMAEEIATL
ncbi:MAG: hypothetical protein J6T05_06130 [Prevotella sp.]|nr:hypothetical protein [Prevotella sp.]